jgi:hypothetical protein
VKAGSKKYFQKAGMANEKIGKLHLKFSFYDYLGKATCLNERFL